MIYRRDGRDGRGGEGVKLDNLWESKTNKARVRGCQCELAFHELGDGTHMPFPKQHLPISLEELEDDVDFVVGERDAWESFGRERRPEGGCREEHVGDGGVRKGLEMADDVASCFLLFIEVMKRKGSKVSFSVSGRSLRAARYRLF